jgi:hypothetical protein
MTKRRGVVADPEIVRLAEYVAGVVGAVMGLDRTALLQRPRPTDELRAGRYVIIALMHHHFGVSQQRIAAALKRDRGVVSDAWHAMEDAINVDFDVAYALNAISDALKPVIECGDAWAEALKQHKLDEALARAREQAEDEATEDLELAPLPPVSIALRCHECQGKGRQRIHRLGNNPRYTAMWAVAEKASPAADGFHTLICVSCNGTGKRLIESRRAGL